MDQLKAILTQVKKYHFWILCGIIVVLPIAVSLAVSGQLSKNISTRKTEVERAYNNVANLEKAPSPPNDKTKQVVAESHQKLVANVFDAWKLFYDKQPTKPANWPSTLPADFRARIALLKPFDQIEDRDRETYQSFIKRHIPALMLTEQQHLPDGRVLYMFQDDVQGEGPVRAAQGKPQGGRQAGTETRSEGPPGQDRLGAGCHGRDDGRARRTARDHRLVQQPAGLV